MTPEYERFQFPEPRVLMRRLVIAALTAATLLAVPAAANASTGCSGSASVTTRGGYTLEFDRYRSLGAHEASEVYRPMNCASVRYAARAVQRKISRQGSYPRLPGMFFDGYVTWDCYSATGHNVQCVEYDSNTGFQFRGRVF